MLTFTSILTKKNLASAKLTRFQIMKTNVPNRKNSKKGTTKGMKEMGACQRRFSSETGGVTQLRVNGVFSRCESLTVVTVPVVAVVMMLLTMVVMLLTMPKEQPHVQCVSL